MKATGFPLPFAIIGPCFPIYPSLTMTTQHQYDVLVIGSGAAGLSLALHLADTAKVAVLSKGQLHEGSTWFAQGGIAAVLDDQDSIDAHVADTLVAGGGLCHPDAVRFTVERSKAAIDWLISQGVDFTKNASADNYHLTQEGGHSHRRIIHSADATGRAVLSSLIERVKEHSNITLLEKYIALDLISQPDPLSRKLRCTFVLCRALSSLTAMSVAPSTCAGSQWKRFRPASAAQILSA